MVRRPAGAVAALLTLLFLLFLPGTASAAGERLAGTLRNEREPVVGVVVLVTMTGGMEVARATSGADGRFEVDLPGPGSYDVSIDNASLPEGVALREGQQPTRTVEVALGARQPVLFSFGEDMRQVTGDGERAVQLAVEGVKFGLIVAMAAIGLSLIYGTTGLTNFAHGELITGGAIIAYVLNVGVGLHLLIAAPLAMVLGGIAGGLLDRGLWRPLRKRGTGLIAMLVVSIGLALLMRNFFQLVFSERTRPFAQYGGQVGIDIGPVTIAPKDLWSIAVSIIVLVLVGIALQRTRIGKATRAVADNPDLAASSGIDVQRVINVVWIAGTALATLGGVLLGLTERVGFQMGFQILLLIFAGVTLGGLGTAYGALLGSLIVGVFTQMSTLYISPDLKNVGALLILILILLVKPNGLLGRAERVG